MTSITVKNYNVYYVESAISESYELKIYITIKTCCQDNRFIWKLLDRKGHTLKF